MTLFFLLLLLAVHSLLRKEHEIRAKEEIHQADQERIAKLTEDIQHLEGIVAILDQIMEKLGHGADRELERLILVALSDANRLKDLEDENRTLSDRVSALQAQVASLTGGSGESCPTQLASAQRELDDAEGQLRHCSGLLARVGFGKKPCWVDRNGKIEYVFAATITEDVIKVSPSWPAQRAEAAQQLPGASALVGTWPTTEFAARAAPILAWSEQNDCRHYVTIEDQATSKAAFKRNLLTVEGYFYKRLLGEAEHRPAAASGTPVQADLPAAPAPSQPDPASGM